MPRLTNGLEQVLTNLGIVGSGYKLFFFQTGTTTLKSTFSEEIKKPQDEILAIPNTNPVVLNSAGRPGVDIFGSDPSLYRMILGTPNSVVGNITTIVDLDPIDNYQINNLAGLNPIPTVYWGATEGTSTTYTLEEPLVDISSYSNTQTFFIDIHIACGASPTLKIKDLAAITLKKYKGDGTTTNLVNGDLQIQRYLCINNGTNIVVLNPEKPFFSGENIFQATNTTRGVFYLPKPITIANNVTDPNNDIDFSAGVFQFSDGSGQAVATAMTKRLDAAWAAGTNQGGLDTGSKINSSWYHCYAIYNPTTLAFDFLFSLGATTPVSLPSGFTKYTWRGAIFVNSSGNIDAFKQDGKTITFSQVFIYNSTAITTTPTDLVTHSPFGIRVKALLRCGVDTLTGAPNAVILKDKITGWTRAGALTGTEPTEVFSWCFTNTTSQIQHYKNNGSSLDAYYITQDGWEIPDNLY